MYTVSSIVGQETKSIKGKMSSIPKVEGITSSKKLCEEFRDRHLKLGNHVSKIRKWSPGGKTHRKSGSGKKKKQE